MKKLLSLMMLLMTIVIGAKAETYKATYNGSEVSNPTGYFTHDTDGKFSFNTKFNGCTYDGVTYTSGLKFEGTTKITFTTDATATITIVQSTYSSNTIKFDDTELAVADAASITGGRVYTIEDVAAGDHTVTRGSGESGLFAITVETAASDVPKITASNASVKATESGVAATVEVPVTGANLTGSTLTATLSGAPAGMSVALDQNAISEGAISATATVSYTATENANGTATLTFSDGTTTKDVTITYVSKVETVELQSVSEETVWDFSKLTVNTSSANYNSKDEAIKLDDTTSPKSTDEIVYTNYDGTDFTIGTDFDGSSIAFTGQYPIRRNSFSQNGTIKIKPSVAGTIIVKFTDTGSKASATAVKRYLVVNGEQTEYWTSRENNGEEPYDAQLNVTTGEISVPAGEVTITGSSAICVSYVKFTPAAAPTTETITIPSDGVLTYVTQNALDFSTINGAFKAYVPTSVNEDKTSVATAEVTSVPAGTALLLKGAAGAYDVEIAESATAPAANLFQVSDGSVAGGDNIFAYSKTNKKFQKVKASVTIPAGKCYLVIEGVSGDALDLDFEGEATAIENVNANENANAAAPVKVIKNGKLYIGNYNVAGQQVK
jgi:hypothetical protein